MIAGWTSPEGIDSCPVETALAQYGGKVTREHPDPRSAILAHQWADLGSACGISAGFYGWIDNARNLAKNLGLKTDRPAHLYAAALARWGENADRQIVGTYCAIAMLPDGRLHAARSPWDAPPLHYAIDNNRAVASPLLRCLFAAGVPRSLDYERIVDELALDWRDEEDTGWHRGTWRVPLGGYVRLRPGSREVVRWYMPPTVKPHDSYREDEAVEEALRLLDEASAKALDWAQRPALSLSGGLDSPLVATGLLNAMEAKDKLDAITFVPDREWDGSAPFGKIGDESALVRSLVDSDMRLQWHVTGRDVGAYDRHTRETYAAMECFAPGLANVGMMHDVYGRGAELGCDAILTAEFGNDTFSIRGESGYREFAARGLWRQWLQLLRNRPGDDRPLWRRAAALTLLPSLPARLRLGLRGLVHSKRRDMAAHFSPLSKSAWEQQRAQAKARGSGAAWADFTFDKDREEAVARSWLQADSPGKDVDLAFEQIHGIRRRDVTAYRPLVEFCMSLPTRAFAWDGTERRLARLMAQKRLPRAIHANPLHGQHNVDWYVRLKRERAAIRETFETVRDHPFLGETLDIDRLIAMIDDWPAQPGWDWDESFPRMLALPRAMMAVRFIGMAEGRNDF